MSIFEYDEERERELIKKAEFESGKEEGIKLGKAQGIELGKAQGIVLGKAQGIELGKTQGVSQGIIETCWEVKLSRKETMEKLCKKLALTEAEAKKQMALFWPESAKQV